MFEELKEELENYLQKECDDFWHVDIEEFAGEKSIAGIYGGIKEFSLEWDGDEWFFTFPKGHPITFLRDIADIAEEISNKYIRSFNVER